MAILFDDALRLRLGPRPSTDHVLGWKIVSVTPTQIVVGVEGATLTADQVVQVQGATIVHATVVHYDRPAARALWAVAAPIHIRVIPYPMEQARRHSRAAGCCSDAGKIGDPGTPLDRL